LRFDQVWKNQEVSENLEETIRTWMPRVHEEIVSSAGDRNVTEWCKKKDCWSLIQSLDLEFAPEFEKELAEGQPLPNVGRYREKKGSETKPLSQAERERQGRVMKTSSEEWQKIITWMASDPDYVGFPIQITGTILGYSAAGWQQIPSPKQTAQIVKYLDAFEALQSLVGSVSDDDF